MEHFCTLFDHRFLPQGMALAQSLTEHCAAAELWILCLDERLRRQLDRLGLERVHTIALESLETPQLLAVKPKRTRAEYCYTLTPFAFDAVFEASDTVQRVTYLDADLFFFDRPDDLLNEFDKSGKHVLITEHAFAPEYAHGTKYGRYCVQFLTVRRTPQARQVLSSWQQQCLDWCYARYENGKYGDQKYLEDWPHRFPDAIHVLEQTHRTLAPWNVSHIAQRDLALAPVFYHFHGFRIVSAERARLYFGYRINAEAYALYRNYLSRLRQCLERMNASDIEIPVLPSTGGWTWRILALWYRLRRRVAYAVISMTA